MLKARKMPLFIRLLPEMYQNGYKVSLVTKWDINLFIGSSSMRAR